MGRRGGGWRASLRNCEPKILKDVVDVSGKRASVLLVCEPKILKDVAEVPWKCARVTFLLHFLERDRERQGNSRKFGSV